MEDISDGLLFSRDGYIFGFLSVRAGDNQLLSEQERVLLAQKLTTAMGTGEEKPIQILSIPRTVDTMGMIEHIAEKRSAAQTDAKLRLLNGEIASLQELSREGAKEPMICVKCWEKASRGADLVLKKRLKEFRAKLSEAQVHVELMNDQEITFLCKLFADLSTYQNAADEVFEDIPLLPQKKRILSRRPSADDEDSASLRNLLTPVGGIRFQTSRMDVGTVTGRIYGAMRYPSELDYGWAVSLVNNSDCVTSITYYPGNPADMGEALARSIHQSARDASSENNARRRKHFEKQAVDADQLIEELDFKSAPVGHIVILAMPFSDQEDKLEDICRAVCGRFAAKRIRLRPLGSVQKDAYKHLSPYYINQPIIDDILMRLCPLETLMGGFPMTVNLYRDDHGSYFARTMDGGVMSLDLLYRGHDRTSSNAIFTGMPGQGKSTAVKHLEMSMYMTGVKVLVVDPEREFRDLCRNLNGTWLDVGGGHAKINPFEVRPVPEDDEIDDPLFRANDNPLALHIQTLDVFFKLRLPSLSDYQRALLKKALIEVYQSKNITWDTELSQLQAADYPIAEDLYQHLAQQKDPALKELSVLLYDMAHGSDSFLWNGHTNVDISNDFIVFDTKQLMNNSDEVKRAQYFNILTLAWQIMSEDRTQPVLLVCDEGHILFDPEIPQTSMYMRNYAKRARKYESALWLVTHSLVDLLNEKVKLSGQAILDCATYKIFFGTDGKNLEETSDLFHLTESEKNILLAQQRGHALLLLGRQHIHVDFDIPPYKLELMGTGGGR